jgi:hypothetical protein
MMSRKNHEKSEIIFIAQDNLKGEKDYKKMTVEEIVVDYPEELQQKMEASLRNLAYKSAYHGAIINIDCIEICPWLYVEQPKEAALAFMLHSLQDEKLITIQSRHGAIMPCAVTVTAKGWKYI